MGELIKGVWHNYDEKFDFQLREAGQREHELAQLLAHEPIELKSESYIWESSGNLCIEFRCRGRPSGIAVTKATYWAHQLRDYRTGAVRVTLLVPMVRMKQLARRAFVEGRVSYGGGDRGEFDNVLVPIAWVIQPPGEGP